jgi:hypothetical protein
MDSGSLEGKAWCAATRGQRDLVFRSRKAG